MGREKRGGGGGWQGVKLKVNGERDSVRGRGL